MGDDIPILPRSFHLHEQSQYVLTFKHMLTADPRQRAIKKSVLESYLGWYKQKEQTYLEKGFELPYSLPAAPQPSLLLEAPPSDPEIYPRKLMSSASFWNEDRVIAASK